MNTVFDSIINISLLDESLIICFYCNPITSNKHIFSNLTVCGVKIKLNEKTK